MVETITWTTQWWEVTHQEVFHQREYGLMKPDKFFMVGMNDVIIVRRTQGTLHWTLTMTFDATYMMPLPKVIVYCLKLSILKNQLRWTALLRVLRRSLRSWRSYPVKHAVSLSRLPGQHSLSNYSAH
jgi:hypothetical protein